MQLYNIQYDEGFWQDIKDIINRYDAISLNLTNRFLDEVWFAALMLSEKFRTADLEKYLLKNFLIKYFSEQKVKLFL